LKPADILELPTSGWDKRIAADLTAEMEQHLAEKVSTIPEMRRFLAVKGYRELRELIERDIDGKSGADALHALMLSMRRYALDRPGMSAATFRNADTDSPEWREAFAASCCTNWARHSWSRSSTTRVTNSASGFLSRDCKC
jgi:hypothetical protein